MWRIIDNWGKIVERLNLSGIKQTDNNIVKEVYHCQ